LWCRKQPPGGSTGDAKKTADKQGQRAIVLPDGYEPLKELDQLESMYEFCLDTTKKLPQPLQTVSEWNICRRAKPFTNSAY